MKKLSVFFIKSFIGPFLATFFISMFMLVMQFLWKYIDDLMGKGLELSIILELLFYVSASLLPLALPLAILLSSLMIMGNLGEHNELTALKSSGLSLYRILRPLTAIVIFLSLGTFYFANYVIPVANYKWHSIIWDIQEKKLTSFLKPGIYTQEIDGFSIKIKERKDNAFKNIIIHDRREKKELKTIIADSGEIYQSQNGDFLFFKLYHGNVFEEMAGDSYFQQDNSTEKKNIFPSRKSNFNSATYKMSMSGFKLQRSKDELFRDNYEMLNVFQINEVADSIKAIYNDVKNSLSYNSKSKHAYFQSINRWKEKRNDSLQEEQIKKAIEKRRLLHRPKTKDTITQQTDDTLVKKVIVPIYSFKNMPPEEREKAINTMKSKVRSDIKDTENQIAVLRGKAQSMKKFEIEFYRKFALSFSIIVLFFIGAPLGAIVKRGGFGAPVVIAALLFMIYYVLITIGEQMTQSQMLSPFWGMFGPSFLLAPIALFLMYLAANDGSFRLFIPKIFKKKK